MSAQGNQQQPDGNLLASLNSILKPTSNSNFNQQDVMQLLVKNMPQLMEYAKQGKLNDTQLNQLRVLSLHSQQRIAAQAAQTQAQNQGQQPAQAQAQAATPPQSINASNAPTPSKSTPPVPPPSGSNNSPLKRKSAGDDVPISAIPNQGYGISATLSTTNPGPQAWPNSSSAGRPTLTGGLPAGRISGTPAQLQRVSEDISMYGLGEGRVGPRKMSQADQGMRRSIQDLVSSIDPNVRVEADVEDLLLDIADEFIDSVTNFGCRLAKHRGGDTLEVRDLQLHLERNHNIRIPGFASDETRLSISQSGAAGGGGPSAKKATQGTHMTLRSSRLAAVQQAKKDTKLV